jgi:LysM repeat protein
MLTMDIALHTYPVSTGALPVTTPDALTPQPSDVSALENALNAAWAEGKWELALAYINQLRALGAEGDLTDKRYAARVNYGHQLLKSGQTEKALEQFNLALGIRPDGREALEGIQQASATPLPTLSTDQEVIRRLDDAWAAQDWNRVIALLEAISATQPDLIDVNSKLYAAHVNHGYQLASQNRLAEAKEAFTRALAIDPYGEEAASGLLALATGTIAATPVPQGNYVLYTVARGDTLYSIARRYGTTARAIMDANGLSNTTIHSGLQLRIPVGR